MRHPLGHGSRTVFLILSAGLLAGGCAARRAPVTAPPADPPAAAAEEAVPPPTEETAATTEGEAADATAPAAEEAPEPPRPRLRDACRRPGAEQALLDVTRQRLEETFCAATLWFDGLLGGQPDLENARAVSGRVELSTLYTQAEGVDPNARLRLRYDLPNLERRVNVFLGRDDPDELVEDRGEAFAIRSSVFGLENEEEWLAGFGYSPPGRWFRKLDVRVGGRVDTKPEVFVQTRYRHNFFVGDRDVWRFRETVFWENREGYGSTTSMDFDRVLSPDLVFRWGSVGTFSESTEGLSWRSATVLFHHLGRSRAVAGEVFLRGSTGSEVKMREYGGRGIYRQPLGKPYLIGELILGYTWPRFEVDEPREGSGMIGFGLELLFGRDPY